MEDQEKYTEALVKLHSGLARQGPGDASFTDYIIDRLPELPPSPRIADIGCGAGAGTLILAKKYRSKVKAVDFSKTFLDQMMHQARLEGLEDLIEPIACDMGNLDWEPGTIDLLWSEGAAYTITVEKALKVWRPLMAADGIVVISEMTYFSNPAPEAVAQYMTGLYPGIKTEAGNVDLINASGFQVLAAHRLPSKAWWDNYYNPLRKNIMKLKDTTDSVMQTVISDTEEEMQFFKEYQSDYGYTFFIMRAI
ncbi:methyltransferase domain-containing protein [Exilibacterium tricleocarpae]|uniref:Methyltransferase domain-containing protein n=1 Tax=Exilibacterium tricleocarpae TaxID=2591008 RepID=A0A545TNJ3_9GAMM|nr:class I SAM-dependent methyltransferase [Exilibacterium tricleocarpae]TQV78785.1 methyltransferase domain-containing protein [Exilibacterium tricleocarpae]